MDVQTTVSTKALGKVTDKTETTLVTGAGAPTLIPGLANMGPLVTRWLLQGG